MRKLLINLVMLILAFTIQICVFPQIAFLSSAPNLLLIVCSFIEGRERGMFYGLVAGLFMDLFYSGPFGFYTLFFINLGYVSGICNKYYYEDYITLPLLLSLASDLIYNLYIYVFRFLIRNRLNFGHYLVSIIIPEIIFTTVTTLVVYRFFLFRMYRLFRPAFYYIYTYKNTPPIVIEYFYNLFWELQDLTSHIHILTLKIYDP